MSELIAKLRTAKRLLRASGPLAVASHSTKILGGWWRQGELWELKKSPYVRLEGCRFRLDNPVAASFRDLLIMGVFEKHERETIRRCLDPNLPVVEVGGCIGVVACTTNRLLREPSKHVVVEANPDLVPVLEANRQLNQCEFVVLQRAVGYGSDVVEFRVNEDNLLASSTQVQEGRTIPVRTISLREILQQFGFGRCTLVCDIEGEEIELVRREENVLAENVVMAVIEVHEKLVGKAAVHEMNERLNRAGFDVVSRVWDTYLFRNRNLVGPGV